MVIPENSNPDKKITPPTIMKSPLSLKKFNLFNGSFKSFPK